MSDILTMQVLTAFPKWEKEAGKGEIVPQSTPTPHCVDTRGVSICPGAIPGLELVLRAPCLGGAVRLSVCPSVRCTLSEQGGEPVPTLCQC